MYERAFLMNLKDSPLSRTPPNNVPLGLLKGQPNIPNQSHKIHPKSGLTKSSPPKHQKNTKHDDEQFDMDI